MRTLAAILTLVAIPLAAPAAHADAPLGDGQRYVGFRNAMNACGFALASDDLVGGVCFDMDSAHAGRRVQIEVADDFGKNTYAYYEMTDARGRLMAIGHFCGSVLTQPVPTGVTKMSVSVYPGVYVRNCADSQLTGVSGSIYATAIVPGSVA